jgi:type IV pilus assembly protein PilC
VSETYAYKVRDGSGNLLTGTLVADSQQLVINRLRGMGYVPLHVQTHKEGLKKEFNFRHKPKLRDVAVFSRQLATMLNSGLPLLKSLTILEEQTESKFLAIAAGEVRSDIEQGSSLSAALAKHPKVFNRLYVAMVRAGETGGVLEAVLERLASNLEREVALRNKIRSAMTYPVVVIGFVVLILVAMLLFIVPQFKSIYASLNGTLPMPTRILLKVSDVFRHDFIIVAVLAAAATYGLRRYKRTDAGRAYFDRLKLKVPVFGKLFQKSALSRFSRTLGVLNKSGVPILQSLDVVSETVNNTLMSKAIADVQQAVKEGESLARPLGRHSVFPPMVVQMLAVGEETGALDTMLEKVSEFYDDEVSAAVDSLTALIEPLMIGVVGGMVGLAVIALYMPMFNVINLIK